MVRTWAAVKHGRDQDVQWMLREQDSSHFGLTSLFDGRAGWHFAWTALVCVSGRASRAVGECVCMAPAKKR